MCCTFKSNEYHHHNLLPDNIVNTVIFFSLSALNADLRILKREVDLLEALCLESRISAFVSVIFLPNLVKAVKSIHTNQHQVSMHLPIHSVIIYTCLFLCRVREVCWSLPQLYIKYHHTKYMSTMFAKVLFRD